MSDTTTGPASPTHTAHTHDTTHNEQRNGNGKWEARWVWTTRMLIAVLTFLALTIWNDLRGLGDDVQQATTAIAVQQQSLQEHERRLGGLELRVFAFNVMTPPAIVGVPSPASPTSPTSPTPRTDKQERGGETK